MELLAESFNLTNRTNSRVNISDDGFYNSAGQFVAYSTKVAGKMYPGQFQINSKFLIAHQCLRAATDSALAKAKFLS